MLGELRPSSGELSSLVRCQPRSANFGHTYQVLRFRHVVLRFSSVAVFAVGSASLLTRLVCPWGLLYRAPDTQKSERGSFDNLPKSKRSGLGVGPRLASLASFLARARARRSAPFPSGIHQLWPTHMKPWTSIPLCLIDSVAQSCRAPFGTRRGIWGRNGARRNFSRCAAGRPRPL